MKLNIDGLKIEILSESKAKVEWNNIIGTIELTYVPVGTQNYIGRCGKCIFWSGMRYCHLRKIQCGSGDCCKDQRTPMIGDCDGIRDYLQHNIPAEE